MGSVKTYDDLVFRMVQNVMSKSIVTIGPFY